MKRFFTYFVFFMAILILISFSAGYAQNDNKLRGIELSGNPNTLHKVFIVFKSTPGNNEKNLVNALGGSVKYTYRIVPAIAASIPEAAINGLQKNPNVTAIEVVGRVMAIGDGYDSYPWGISHIGSESVHEGLFKGYGVKVAIIDTGIDDSHGDLANNYAGGYDFANGDDDPDDDNSHGTHVAGIVAADDNSNGIIGVAPDAELFALKILDASGTGWDYDVVAALQWIADYNSVNPYSPIRITNNSYAGSDLNTETVKNAFDYLASAGVLHVAAAGNSGNVPGRGDNVDYPGRFESVIAVAATDDRDRRAFFSSTGPDVELSAPGVSIESTVPGTEWSTGLKSGTSMASPHVAGVAALVMATGMTDPDQVRNRLITTADDLGDVGKDDKYGWGLVDANEAVYCGPVDNPPTVSITDPIDGATIKGKYIVIAEASDDDAVTEITLSIDGHTPEPMILGTNDLWSYEWDTTQHTEGNHNLIATATDSALQSTESAAISVTVNNENYPPTASFTYTCSGLTCEFDASGASDPDGDGTITAYSWDFGDDKTGTGKTTTHLYAGSGGYTVTLTVTDDGGLTDSSLQTVNVEEPSNGIIFVSDLDRSSTSQGSKWTAEVTIEVSDAIGAIDGATVYGDWSDRAVGSASCTTNSSGTCLVSYSGIHKKVPSVTFTIADIKSESNYSYDPSMNTDPDGDSDGTTITVEKP
ncbi:MAG: S8 family serine peptidase [Deltaproteobacteria bacterium]|nr:S8 family serine peptidase [Deltaproteobacteria bacterium]